MNKSKCKLIPHQKLKLKLSHQENEPILNTEPPIPPSLVNRMTETDKECSNIKPIQFLRSRNYTGSVKIEPIFKDATKLQLCNKTFDKQKLIRTIPLPSSKNKLKREIKKLEYINKPMNLKLDKILNEEEKVIKQENSKTNNFSFDFGIFNDSASCSLSSKKEANIRGNKNMIGTLTPIRNNSDDICYLDKYSKIIRNNVINEEKAHHYIEKLKYIIKSKENQYNTVTKLLSTTIINSDENKIKQSLEIDNYLEKMNLLQCSIEDRIMIKSSSKQQIDSYISESNEKTNKIIQEIDHLYKESKQNEIITKNREKELRSFAKQLHFEIKHLKKEINASIKVSIDYYLDLLSKGTDTRNEGISWIVRKLLELDYIPKLEDFPNFFNEQSASFIVEVARKQLENSNLINKLKKIRKNILSLDSNNKKLGESLEKSLKHNLNSYKTKNKEVYLIKKMEELLSKHDYCHVTPYQEDKIQFCLKTPNINKYRIRLKECSNLFNFNPRPKSVKEPKDPKKNVFNKIFNKKNYNFEKNEQYNLLKSIIDIKDKMKKNEYEIDKLKSEHLEYIQHNNLDKHELVTSLFGNSNKYKYQLQKLNI